MERLQSQLFEAATRGDVSSLLQLLLIDPLLLERDIRYHNSETALHVSALKGHPDFVKEIIGIKPELTNDLNSQGSSPLHLASAKGHVNVVSELLSNPTMCLARDKDGLTPLHLAAMKGQVAVMELLLQAKPEAARLTLYGGETILHLCVKNWQLEALKLLASSVSDPEFVKCKDGEGNNLLHLAVEYKQVEISEIRESLNRAAGGAAAASMADKRIDNDEHPVVKMIRKLESGITIVASVVAAMTLQVAVNPPGGVWQDDNYLFDKDGNTVDPLGNRISYAVDSQNRTVRNPHRAGYSIMGTNHPHLVSHLYLSNTIAYYSCMSIILLMLTALPSRYGIFAFVLILIAFFAIEAAVGTYEASVRAWMPPKEYGESRMTYKIGTISFFSCIVLSLAYLWFIWGYQMRRFREARRAKPNNFGV